MYANMASLNHWRQARGFSKLPMIGGISVVAEFFK